MNWKLGQGSQRGDGKVFALWFQIISDGFECSEESTH
jgi:hypothetical protein